MIYLKKFEEHSEYEAFTGTTDFILPNVSFCEAENEVHYNPIKPIPSNAVDLGLPSGLLWAKCNVGATTETEYGDYFMWGSTTPNTNDNCDWENAPFNNGSSDFNQTYFDTVKDTVCPNGILAPEYDAVHQIMGGDWRMPTKEDFEELISGTTYEWVADYNGSGVNGGVFTSKDNGNTLFIPTSGYHTDTTLWEEGEIGEFWCSSICTDWESNAWDFAVWSNECGVADYTLRCSAYSLRGVL